MTCPNNTHTWILRAAEGRPFLMCSTPGCTTPLYGRPHLTTGDVLLGDHIDELCGRIPVNVTIDSQHSHNAQEFDDGFEESFTLTGRHADEQATFVDNRCQCGCGHFGSFGTPNNPTPAPERLCGEHHAWVLNLSPGGFYDLECGNPGCVANHEHLGACRSGFYNWLTIEAIPVTAVVSSVTSGGEIVEVFIDVTTDVTALTAATEQAV